MAPDEGFAMTDLLDIYLSDHFAGATGGVALIRRIAESHDGEAKSELTRVADDIDDDRTALREIMRRVGARPRRYKAVGAWVGEKFARLKSNGRLFRRSGLSSVLELEAMQLGVEGKAALWLALRLLADTDERLDQAALDELRARAESQIAILERLRCEAVRRQLS